MGRGIALVGLNGSGKSTLGHALAKELGYFEIDVEDYYFPEQKESRQAALEGEYDVKFQLSSFALKSSTTSNLFAPIFLLLSAY